MLFYRGHDFKDYNGIYDSKNLQKPKFLILCTKTHSYELIFHPNIEESQTKAIFFIKKKKSIQSRIFFYFFIWDLRFLLLQWSSIVKEKS